MIKELKSPIFAACAAVLALAFTPGIALGQPSQAADPATVPMSAQDSRAVILSLADLLRERFAFRERGIAAASQIEAMQQRGDFDHAGSAAELLALIEARITPLVNDRHFRVRYLGADVLAGFSEGPPSNEEMAAFHEEVRLRGSEIPDVRWLPGNVGYIRINMFLDTPPGVEKLAAAMGMLADTGALIIDVRGAPGGAPAGVANVIGHLVAERTATVRVETAFDPSANQTFHAEPRTPGFIGKPVYVLTDEETGSGAEEFAYDLQAMQRATLVGQTTAGAANPGGFRPLASGFAAFIPMQIVNHTLTGTNWEGVGVRPDVEVASEQALEHAHRLALEAILNVATGVRKDIAEEGLASLGPPQD
ncbi:MAG: S41 family peptidase [Pseudomonadota bacterium]|nr:S41 family peptidase [Pseudomonadota bacterium]